MSMIYMMDYIKKNNKVLNRLQKYNSEISYIFKITENDLNFVAPEVIAYCYVVINQCITEIYTNNKITDDELYEKISRYLH